MDQALQSQPSGTTGNPALLSAAATTMLTRSILMRAVYGGTETMRAMGQALLPIYEKESTLRYNARLNSTFALNKLREAVDAASAKPFKTLMKFENTDADLDLWVQDIDLQGNHLHIFAHQFFNDAMLVGQSHILIDHPSTVNLPNLAAQQAAGVRPFMKHIKDDQLVAAYSEYVGGDHQCVHARIRGQRMVRDADFKETIIDQIFVIEKEAGAASGVVQLWEQPLQNSGVSKGLVVPKTSLQPPQGTTGQWSLVSEQQITIAEVPLVTLFAGDKEADYVTRPVFMDLAYKQIEHWISSSDQRSILAAARFPMLACSGVELPDADDPAAADFAIGPYKILNSPEANGRWYYVEPKGSAIESGRLDLEALEMHMDMMALNPVTGTHRQYVPQNERDIQETRVHSVVHDLAIACQDGIEKAIRFMGMWAGNRDYTKVRAVLNTEFSNTKDKLLEVAQLVKLWEKKGVSRQLLLSELKNRNILGEEFDLAAELKLMATVDALEAQDAASSTQGSNGPTSPPKKTTTPTAPPADWPKGQNRPTPQV
jgi:hypothetical protein